MQRLRSQRFLAKMNGLNPRKIKDMGALLYLPAIQHSKSSPPPLGWIGCAD